MSQEARGSWAALMDRTRADVRTRGFAVVPAFDSDMGAIYSYTVGLSERDHPELVVVGLRASLASKVLSAAVPSALATSRGIEEGDRLPGIIAGASLVAVSVIDTRRLLPAACVLYAQGSVPVDAYQLVYPDGAGLMPWQQGAEHATRLLGFEPMHPMPDVV